MDEPPDEEGEPTSATNDEHIPLLRNDKAEQGKVKLFKLFTNYKTDEVRNLIEEDPGLLDVEDEAGRTILFHAVHAEDVEIVQFLLGIKPSIVNHKDKRGRTAIFLGLPKSENQSKSLEILDLLLKHGAQVDTEDNYGHNSLYYASTHHDVDRTETLFYHGASIDHLVDSESYITLLKEKNIMERDKLTTEKLISYFQIHLFLCTRFNTNLLKYFLSNLQSQIKISKLKYKDVYNIFHTNITYEGIQISCLNTAVLNRDEKTAELLLEFEKILHQNETHATLRCIRENVRDDLLKLMLAKQCRNQEVTDCLQDKCGINKKGAIYNAFMVIIETMFLSILFWLLDLVNDTQLCFQFKKISQIDSNSSILIMNEIASSNSTNCNETSIYDIYFPNSNNDTQIESSFSKLRTQYNNAYWITLGICIFNVFTFIMGALIQIRSPTWIETHIDRLTSRLDRKKELESRTWYEKGDSEELNQLKSEKINMKLIFYQALYYIAIIFWPILILMPHQYLNNVSTTASKVTKARFKTEILWKLVKVPEIGLENVIQLGVQIYLLIPLLETLSKWTLLEITSSSFRGILGILSFGLITPCSIDQILGKIGFTILGMSFGHTMMRMEKPGLSFTEKLLPITVLFLSSFIQVVSRLLAIRNLMILEDPTEMKYVFFLIHFILVLVIKMLFETRMKHEIWPSKKPWWFCLMKLKRFVLCVLSSACSMIVNVNLHRNTVSLHLPKHSLLSQMSFQLLIMLENLCLTTLPFITTNLFNKKFDQLSYVGVAWFVNLSWIVVIIIEVYYYRRLHVWYEINGVDENFRFISRILCSKDLKQIQSCTLTADIPCCKLPSLNMNLWNINSYSGMKGAFDDDDDISRNCEKNLIEVVLDNEENLKKISASIEQNIHEQYWVLCKEGNVADVENYIKNMPSKIHDADIEGRTGLFYAVKRGQIEIAKLLLATDRKLIEHKDNWGRTVLHVCGRDGNLQMLEILLQNKASVLEKDLNGHTTLYYASKHNHRECTELLLFYGSPLDQLINGEKYVTDLLEKDLSINSKEVINKKALISYIQIHLFLGIRFKDSVLKCILLFLVEKKDHLELNFGDLYEIFHTKLVLDEIQVSSLNAAASDNQLKMALFILELERNLHLQNLVTVRKCLKENVNKNTTLRQKFNNQLGCCRVQRTKITKCSVCLLWFFAIFNAISDSWAKYTHFNFSYHMYEKYSNLSEDSTQWNDMIKNYTNQTFKMKEYDENYDHSKKFVIAKWFTLAVIMIEIAMYISGIIFVPTTWIDKYADKNKKKQKRQQELGLQTWLTIKDEREVAVLESEWLLTKWFFFCILKFLSKLLWPIMLVAPHKILYGLLHSPSNLFISNARSRNMVHVSHYLHSNMVRLIQVIIPMWILLPLFGIMSNWNVLKLLSLAFTGIVANILPNFIRDLEYDTVISFIGHISWLVISMVWSISARRCLTHKIGQICYIFMLRYFFILITSTLQIISRLLVFQNLMLLPYSGLMKYTTFILIHFSWLLVTRILFETRHKRNGFQLTRLNRPIMTILSCLCSTIFLVDVHTISSRNHYSDHNMLTQISFYILILLENLVLTILPLVEPSLFPNTQEFNQDLFQTNFLLVNTFWLVVIFMEVVYYRFLHLWSGTNGWQFDKNGKCYIISRLICFPEMQKITFNKLTFVTNCGKCICELDKIEDYTGIQLEDTMDYEKIEECETNFYREIRKFYGIEEENGHNSENVQEPPSDLQFGSYYFLMYITGEIILLTYKSTILPYPDRNMAAESLMLISFCLVECIRLYSAHKGNLTENSGSVIISLVMCIPSTLAALFFLLWQTYILRIEIVLGSVFLFLEGVQILLAFLCLLAFSKSAY